MEREGLGDLIYQQPTAQQCVLTTEQFSKRVLDSTSVAYNALELEHNKMDGCIDLSLLNHSGLGTSIATMYIETCDSPNSTPLCHSYLLVCAMELASPSPMLLGELLLF